MCSPYEALCIWYVLLLSVITTQQQQQRTLCILIWRSARNLAQEQTKRAPNSQYAKKKPQIHRMSFGFSFRNAKATSLDLSI